MPQDGTNSVAATTATSAAWAALAPQATITSVTIASPPVVKFTVKDAAGSPVVGLGNKSKAATATVAGLTNIGFTLAKLVPGTNGAPNKWVSYNVLRPATVAEKTAAPTVDWYGTFPTTDTQGTLIDFGDGSYQYTFYRDPKQAATIVASLIDSADGLSKKADLGDVSFDPTLTHRLGIQIGGATPGTGTNFVDKTTLLPLGKSADNVNMVNTENKWYDFRPDGVAVTSTRNIVKIDSCSGCHAGKVLAHGSRKDPQYCVTCHTDQIRYTFSQEASSTAGGMTLTGTTRPTTAVVDGRALGNFPNMVHHIHMGEGLVKQGYFFNAASEGKFNDVRYPQDIRNCTKCHDGSTTAVNKTDNGDNWKTVPSQLACGACHDGINFKTGTGVTLADAAKGLTSTTIYGGKAHGGGAQGDDSACALCHKPASIDISASHIPVTPPDPNNALSTAGGNTHSYSESIDANQNNLPDGAIKVSYDVSSVSVNSSGNPVIVFKMLQNGTAVAFNDPATKTEIWNNYIGSPSLYFVWAETQDGITAPADFNKSASVWLKALWNKTKAGTLTLDATTGYYTATLTGTTIPTTAVMVTGGVGFTYGSGSQPLTQTNVPGYPVTASTIVPTQFVGGLDVVAPNVSMVAKNYTGRRPIVETARCNACHEKLGVFTASAFHSGQRNDATTCSWCHNPNRTSSGWVVDSEDIIHAIHGASKRSVAFNWTASSAENFSGVGYPGVLKKCETCHLPGTYDFSAKTSSDALANRLYRTAATGAGFTTAAAATSFSFAPADLVPRDVNYGAAGAGANLVSSPIAAACFSCHDGKMVSDASQKVRDHIEGMGTGSIYRSRTTALAKQEGCILCHGPNSTIAPIKAMHAK